MRVAHYLNQFYGRIGGEEAADAPLRVVDGPIGPGVPLQQLLEPGGGRVVATLICGDNFANEQPEDFKAEVVRALQVARPDVLIAGPAFNAGRYGLACGEVCLRAAQDLRLPSLTALYPENPAASLYRRKVLIVPTTATAASMQVTLRRLADFAVRLGRGESLGPPWAEGYLPHGLRRIEVRQQSAAERALDLLAARLAGKPFETEIPLPEVARVDPAPPIAELSTATLAVVTTSGLVPHGNPDKLRQSYSVEWRSYPIEGLSRLAPADWESIHGGFDTSAANADPHLVLPLDALRALEGASFGRLHPAYFVTAGVGTAVSAAQRMGAEIAADLLKAGVQGVILTAT
jgi:glycine reductase complex component B subunit gamma